MSSKTPTQRTIDAVRAAGGDAGNVERVVRRNATAKERAAGAPQMMVKRFDLFGCIDIVVMRPDDAGFIGIQATSASNVAPRITKIVNEPRALRWLNCGGRLQVWGWRKRQGRWIPRIVEITKEMFTCHKNNLTSGSARSASKPRSAASAAK